MLRALRAGGPIRARPASPRPLPPGPRPAASALPGRGLSVRALAAPALVALLTVSCRPDPAADDTALTPRGAAPAWEATGPVLKRLTNEQYTNSLHTVFGDDVLVSDSLEPDAEFNGLRSVGAGIGTVSPLGVEQFETAAFDVAEQVFLDETRRARVMPCTPTDVVDDPCADAAVRSLGRTLWRRPLTEAEAARLLTVEREAAAVLGDFWQGMVYASAAMLQSPNFLYRVELGEDDPDQPGVRRYTSSEMATRLAYFLWNTTPDAELLDAADAGELVTDAGLATQLDRMLTDERAREGVRAFFTDMLGLYKLDELSKDPTVYLHYNEEVGALAREETLLGLDWLVWEEDGDYRDTLTTRTTFIDRKLAAIYNVPAPAREGFGQTELPADGPRQGLLGQVSFLALAAHANTTSPTRRGLFIREVLLCQDLPPPPANVDASIPEPDADAHTMRERLAKHMEDPYCASCHRQTDPIGLAFENFDGLGGWRPDDEGYPVDPSGDFDTQPFADAVGLENLLSADPDLGACLVRTMFQYSRGQMWAEADEALMDWHSQGLREEGHRVQWLLRDIALSPGFRTVGEVQ